MNVIGRKIRHVGLRPHCGICTRPMKVLDRCVVLLGNEDSSGYIQHLGPFIFPDYGPRFPEKTCIQPCRKPVCCKMDNPEVATVHYDCFEFIVQHNDFDRLCDYLWVAAAWQVPWRQAPHFRLEEKIINPDWSLFDKIGLPEMKMLSLEIIQMIYRYSPSSLIWQFHSASQLAQQFSTISVRYKTSAPLDTISTWKRGSQPITMNTTNELPVFVAVVDAWGLQEIKRLPKEPDVRIWRTDDRVFVVLDVKKIKGIKAHFKFGFSRLELVHRRSMLPAWDTPTPPALEQCRFLQGNSLTSPLFKTIDLRNTKGITFFYSCCILYGVHAHTEKAVSAEETHKLLSRRLQRFAVWIYMPLPENDTVLALGSRKSVDSNAASFSACLLFRMRQAGDVAVGHGFSRMLEDSPLTESPPTTLIYNVADQGPVSITASYSSNTELKSPTTPFDIPDFTDPPFLQSYYSSASLENVDSISIFSNEQSGFCMGILLQYQNGAQRSLGQCRLHVDPVEEYIKPIHLCISPRTSLRPGTEAQLQTTLVKANCTQEHEHIQEHEHGEQGWECFAMEGELEFWFTSQETRLTVIGRQH